MGSASGCVCLSRGSQFLSQAIPGFENSFLGLGAVPQAPPVPPARWEGAVLMFNDGIAAPVHNLCRNAVLYSTSDGI